MSVSYLQAKFLNAISPAELEALSHHPDSKLINTRSDGRPKMLETSKGEIIRIFYPSRKRFSSNHRRPHALRFDRNAKRLVALGFHAPHIISLDYCLSLNTYVLAYEKRAGQDTRFLIKDGNKKLIPDVIRYIADLHEKGVFFRSLHLGNLLYQPDNTMALLDITDVRFRNKPLSILLRYRNIRHMFQARDDRDIWREFDIHTFLEVYCSAAGLSPLAKKLLSASLRYFYRRSFFG